MYSAKIKEIRRIMQLNQTEFAEKLGVSRSIVSEFENNTREPSKEFMIALSKLGISLDWFLTGQGIPFIISSPPITAQEAAKQALSAISKKTRATFDEGAMPEENTFNDLSEKANINIDKPNNRLFTGNSFPPKPSAETSANEADQAANLQNDKLTNTPHPAKSFPPHEPAASPVKEAVSGSIEALAREAVAPALTAIEEKIADTATAQAQSETVLAAHTAALAAHTQQLNEISAALRKLQELSGQPLEDTAHERKPLYTAAPAISVVKEPETSYTALTEEDEETPTTRLPLIENLAAGVPREPVDTYETYPVPTSYLKAHKTYFVAKIHGTSMTEAGIADGCHVLLEAKETPESGDIVIAHYENQTTLKRLKQKDDGRWELLYEDGSRAKIELIDPDWAIQAKFIRVV